MAKKKSVVKESGGQLSLLSAFENINYTEEQKDFIQYDGNKSVILSATAGAGKTFSVVERLKELVKRGVPPEKIIFFSYTKAATEELQKRIGRDDVKITTIHAFALGILAKVGKFKKIATFYDFITWYKDKYKPNQSASRETKTEFYELIGNLYEESEYISSMISSYKLQISDGIKCPMPLYFIQYTEFLKETKSRDFSDMLVEVRDLLKEDKWLKMFRNQYDYIFVDEYQDTSTIQLQILLALNAKYYYLIGDVNQCLLPNSKITTKDGIKNIEDVKEGDFVLSGKGSGNLKFSLVTEKIINENKIYDVVKIETELGKKLICTKNHIIFANYEKQLKNRFFVYLMYKKDIGFRIGITQLYNSEKIALKNSLNFKARLTQENVDKIWLIYTSNSYLEVKVKEQIYSLNYGIPTVVFKNRNVKNDLFGKEYVNRVFEEINTYERGFKLLEDLKYNFEYPHYFPESNHKYRKNIRLFLCADGRDKNAMSAIEIHTNIYDDVVKLEKEFGIKLYKNIKKDSWRFRRNSINFGELKVLAEKIQKKVGYDIKTKSCLIKGKYFDLLPASEILEGMQVYIKTDDGVGVDIVKNVTKETYSGITYDLNIDKVHNFCADGFFVHNSIFGFSGTNCGKIEAMLKNRRDTIIKKLSINFRSDKKIIDNSNRFSSLQAIANSKEEGFVKRYIISQIEASKNVLGHKKSLDLVTVLDSYSEVVVLARTNVVIRDLEFELLKLKYPMKYFNYITNSDFTEYKKGNVHVNLQGRLDKLKPYFNNNENEIFAFIEYNKNCKKFVTSIHKSKGREFDYCVVVNSIDPGLIREVGLDKILSPKQLSRLTFNPMDEEDTESKNIHYVAVSRARHGLYYMLYNF